MNIAIIVGSVRKGRQTPKAAKYLEQQLSKNGVLKNTLDYFYPEFSKKPIGLLTVSSGNLGGINVHHDLQKFILHIRAYAVPMKYLLTKVQNAFDQNGNVTDEHFEKSTSLFIQELTWLTEAIKNQKSI